MFSWRITRITLALLMSLGLLVPFGIAQEAVQNPETLVILRASQIQTLDPSYSFDTGSNEVIKNVYQGLIELRGGATDTFMPSIATEVPTLDNGGISADGLTYTFTIRDNVLFGSGETVTPEDVEYSIERIMVMDRAGGPSFLYLDVMVTGESFSSTRGDEGLLPDLAEKIDNAVTVNGNVVTMKLVKPFPPFLQVLSNGSGSILNKSFVVENGGWPGFTGDRAADTATLEQFNNPGGGSDPTITALFEKTDGAGAFKLVSWDRAGGELLLERNDNFNPPGAEWGAVFNRAGPAAIKNILIREVPENADRELALQQGTADIATISPRSRQPIVQEFPGVRIVDDIPGLSVASSFFNFDIQGIDDGTAAGVGSGTLDGNGIPANFFVNNDVREAFVKSFDFETYIDQVFLGKAVSPATPVVSALPFFNPDQERAAFDAAGALAAMQRATIDGKSVFDTGFSFGCFFNEGNESRRIACEVTKAALEAMNPGKFEVSVSGVPWPVYLNQLVEGIMPYYTLGWAPDFLDAGNFIDQWMASNGTFSGFNGITALPAWSEGGSVTLSDGSSFAYANWDELLVAAFNEPNTADRQLLYNEAQAKFVEHDVAIMLANAIGFNAQRQWVNGWYANPADTFPQYYAVNKLVGGVPNCEQLAVQGATTSDGSC